MRCSNLVLDDFDVLIKGDIAYLLLYLPDAQLDRRLYAFYVLFGEPF